jgi:hypothetical protein
MGRTKKYFTEEDLVEAQRLYSKKSYYKNLRKKNGNQIILSPCQEKAKTKLEEFIENNELKNFLLTGNAGTGKTLLICFIMIEYFLSKYDKIYFLAPTNKAVEVLKEKVEYEYKNKKIIEGCNCDDFRCDCKKNKIEFKTTTQFFNSRPRYDLKTGKEIGYAPNGYNILKIDKKNYYYSSKYDKEKLDLEKLKEDDWIYCLPNNCNDQNILLIIDECSMINDLEMKFMTKIFKNVKKIYLGDRLQLPPVDENKKGDFVSEIFNEDYPTINMTTIKRTKNEDISKLYEITRDIIIDENVRNKSLSSICNKIRNNIIKKIELKDKIKQDLEENKNFIILSYRNVEMNKSNEIVKECLEQNKKKEFGFFYNTQYLMKEYYEKNLKNNIYFEILSMKKIKTKFDISEESINVIWIQTNKGIIKIIENINDENIFYEWYNNKKNLILNKELICDKKRNELINYLYSQDKYIRDTYDELEGAIAYLEKVRRLFVPRGKEIFQLCYSLTINKSQGSSYDKVYLNLSDIYENKFLTLTNRSKYLYVATTRAVKEIEYF